MFSSLVWQIEGGRELEGEIVISGAKNSAGALIPASLVTNNKVILKRVPRVIDIDILLEILKKSGARVEKRGDQVVIERYNWTWEKIDKDLVSRTRVSVLLLAPLVLFFKKFFFPSPGGDRIGVRPISCHLDALSQIGMKWRREGSLYYFERKRLLPGTVYLSEFSVTATELMLIVLSSLKGKSKLVGGALEPHVQNLVVFLRKLGAKIEITPDHVFYIEGPLSSTAQAIEHKVEQDHIELGTFLVAGALLGKEIVLYADNLDKLSYIFSVLKRIGVSFRIERDKVVVRKSKKGLKACRVQALPWPGFPTDLLPMTALLLTQAEGKSLVHDPLYEGRQSYLLELKKMGADIEVVDPHRALIFGPTPLQGIEVRGWDIRAGATMVLAGLIAKGYTKIHEATQILRGYEDFDQKLISLGASIEVYAENYQKNRD